MKLTIHRPYQIECTHTHCRDGENICRHAERRPVFGHIPWTWWCALFDRGLPKYEGDIPMVARRLPQCIKAQSNGGAIVGGDDD